MCHEERDDAGHEGAEHVHIVSGAKVSFEFVLYMITAVKQNL
jgi:hypothetical protein